MVIFGSLAVLSGFLWFFVSSGGFRWFLVALSGFWWLVVRSDFWFFVIPGVSMHLVVIPVGFWQFLLFTMVLGGSWEFLAVSFIPPMVQTRWPLSGI